MTHPLNTRNVHFSKTLATFALLTGLLVACGDGASMPDDMNPDEGGTSGTDQGTGAYTGTGASTGTGGTTTGTGGSDNGSGGTVTGTGGTTPDGTGGTAATGGSAATGGTPGTGGVVSTGGTPATGGAGGTVSSEVPKPKAELTKEDVILGSVYVLFKDDIDKKIKIGRSAQSGIAGCHGEVMSTDLRTYYTSGVYIRTATKSDFDNYPNNGYQEDFFQDNAVQIRGITPNFFQKIWDNALNSGNSGECPGFPKE